MRIKNRVSQFAILTVTLYIICQSVFSKEYKCPGLPIIGRIGDNVQGGWVISQDRIGKRAGLLEKVTERYFGQEYKLSKWISLELTNYEKNIAVIGCCGRTTEGKKYLCITQTIESGPCVNAWAELNEKKFICGIGTYAEMNHTLRKEGTKRLRELLQSKRQPTTQSTN